MAVMMALRAAWMATRPARTGPAPTGPPQFILDANRELLERLTGLFEPHRDELPVPPETAAAAAAHARPRLPAPGVQAIRRR